MRHTRSPLVLLVALAITLMAASPAAAERARIRDRRGDAPSYVDLTGAQITNGGQTLKLIAKAADLSARRPAHLTLFIDTAPRKTVKRIYRIESDPRLSGGGYRNRLVWSRTGTEAPPTHRVTCPALRVKWHLGAADEVRASLPQTCLGRYAGGSRFTVTLFRPRPFPQFGDSDQSREVYLRQR